MVLGTFYLLTWYISNSFLMCLRHIPNQRLFSATAPGLPDRGQVQSPSSSRSRESVFSLWFPGLLRKKQKQKFFLLSFHHFPCSVCSFYLFAPFLVLHIAISIIFHMCANFKVFMICISRGRLPIHERATSGSMLPSVISESKLLVLYFLVFCFSKGMTIPTLHLVFLWDWVLHA